MDKFTDVDLIGFDIADMGIVEVRISKSRWDGAELITREFHRAVFTPGIDVEGYLEAVNGDLISMGFPALGEEDMAEIRGAVHRRQTPERVANYEAQYNQMASAEPLPAEEEMG